MAVQVPFCREILEEGMTGDDIIAHKRAISRHLPDAYPWREFTPYFGEFFGNAVEIFNEKHGLNIASKKRCITVNTHEKLEAVKAKNKPKEFAFDAFAKKLATDFCVEWSKTPEMKLRQRVVDAWRYWYTQRDLLGYEQNRPFELVKVPGLPRDREMDCSEYFTLGWYSAGGPDPNRLNYSGIGYTGTLMNSGTRVFSVRLLLPGDPIFYGFTTSPRPGFRYGDPTHVAGYAGQFFIDGRWRHMVYSMGSSPGPHFKEYDYRSINRMVHIEL